MGSSLIYIGCPSKIAEFEKFYLITLLFSFCHIRNYLKTLLLLTFHPQWQPHLQCSPKLLPSTPQSERTIEVEFYRTQILPSSIFSSIELYSYFSFVTVPDPLVYFGFPVYLWYRYFWNQLKPF